MKIEKRVANVKAELVSKGIGKDKRTLAGGKYKYRGVDNTMGIVSALHVKHGINIAISEIESLTVNQGANVHITCVCTFRFSSSDNREDFIETKVIGEGRDNSDKSSGKAHSYAYKNCMFTFYEIPVEGQNVDSYDPRIDNEEADSLDSTLSDESSEFIEENMHVPYQNLGEDFKKEWDAVKEKGLKEDSEFDKIQRFISYFTDYLSTGDIPSSQMKTFKDNRKKFVALMNKYHKNLSSEENTAIKGLLGRTKEFIDTESNDIANLARKHSKGIDDSK